MKKAVYAGSFDPITNGHLWMVQEGAKLFDELTVAIGINPSKKYAFSLDERCEMLREATKYIPSIVIDSFENKYLVDYAKSIGACYILRGIRNEEDYAFERGMRNVNSDLGPGVVTAFFMPPRELSEVSSGLVRGLVGPEGWEDVVREYVPRSVYNKFLQKFSGCLAGWASLWHCIGACGEFRPFYNNVVELYSNENRFYHNFAHIADSLSEFKQVKGLVDNPNEIEMAIWLHDVVYAIFASDNEEKSAEFARLNLDGCINNESVNLIADLILATKHASPPVTNNEKYLVDIDLSILGKPADQFWQYERDIRAEYCIVPESQFRARRAVIIKGLLDRPSIYNTPLFRQKYEQQARNNLERSLHELKD